MSPIHESDLAHLRTETATVASSDDPMISEVQEQASRLDGALVGLGQSIEALTERLAPVLRAERDSEPRDMTARLTPESPVGQQLSELTVFVEQRQEVISSLLLRLAV